MGRAAGHASLVGSRAEGASKTKLEKGTRIQGFKGRHHHHHAQASSSSSFKGTRTRPKSKWRTSTTEASDSRGPPVSTGAKSNPQADTIRDGRRIPETVLIAFVLLLLRSIRPGGTHAVGILNSSVPKGFQQRSVGRSSWCSRRGEGT